MCVATHRVATVRMHVYYTQIDNTSLNDFPWNNTITLIIPLKVLKSPIPPSLKHIQLRPMGLYGWLGVLIAAHLKVLWCSKEEGNQNLSRLHLLAVNTRPVFPSSFCQWLWHQYWCFLLYSSTRSFFTPFLFITCWLDAAVPAEQQFVFD